MASPFEAAFVGRALINAEVLGKQINLYFPESYIAIYNPVTVQRGERRTSFNAADFQSELSAVVGEALRSVEARPNHHVALLFESGARLEIATAPDDYSGPEAFSARGPEGELFVKQ